MRTMSALSFCFRFRYPKPGTANPMVTLKVADLADPKNIRTRDLKPPPAFANM